ncbi:MAG: hypothetical protein HC860_21120 [Alkalinema sp. RU_4_3]|nr:hypothetical protein [Alkalinema sp. RU_4_3]
MKKYSVLASGLMVGTMVVVGAIATAQPVQAIDNSDGFILPSGNIYCISHEVGGDLAQESPILRCQIGSQLNPMPPQPKSCNLDWGHGLVLSKKNKPATVLCAGDTMYSPDYPTLDYGKTWKKSGFSCKSTANGLTCTNGKGNGFFLNREEWKVF